MNRVNSMLYEAKTTGKNRIVQFNTASAPL
jgi:PleD family two-component response regulator